MRINGEKQTYFQESWLPDPKYSHRVQRVKLKTDYRCKLCKKENKLGSSGVGALKMISEFQSMYENCQGMQDLIRKFDINFVNLAKKAEENTDIKFLIEGNVLKRKAEEKSAHFDILKKRKEELISEIKSFPKQHSISYTRDK